MPALPAKISVTVNAATPRGFISGIPVILGYDSSFGTQESPKVYFDPKAVATDHGASTKTTAAAAAMFKARARRVVIIKPQRTAVVAENLGLTQAFTLDNFPVTKTVVPVFRKDAVAKTVVYKYDSPIVGSPASTEVFFNPFTGEGKWDGVPSTSAEADYSHFDYTGLKDALNSQSDSLGPYELFVFPDYDADSGSYGDYRKLAEMAEEEDWVVIAMLPPSETVANATSLIAAIDSPHLCLFPHKDTVSDVAALVAGVASRTDPDVPLTYKPIPGLNTDYYLPSEIGDVEASGTFEFIGANPIHRIGNQDVPTNERTAVDYADSSGEIYLSRVRLKINLKHRLRTKLAAFLVSTPKVPISDAGKAMVSGVIAKELEDLTARGAIYGLMDKKYPAAIAEPDLDSQPSSELKARKFGPFQAACTMIEGAHQILADVTLEVAG